MSGERTPSTRFEGEGDDFHVPSFQTEMLMVQSVSGDHFRKSPTQLCG